MKRVELRLIAFLVLIFILTGGLSYVALNHVAHTNSNDTGPRMAIALVNEDEGTMFNNERLTFGDAFVRNVGNDFNHEWFVVSRGVAESGLEKQTYDMMIVIPNDFSDKALSIDSASPEPVTLNYKINASENDEIRAEAEKAASEIINDFNRRVIEVYFASVIGNLHEAQDQISSIVDEQAKYTATYNNAIQNPLSNYTNQFNAVKNYTEISRGGFGSLEEELGYLTDRLTEEVESTQNVGSSINDITNLKESNQTISQSFSESLNQYNSMINNIDTKRQLEQLVFANERIQYQFQLQEEGATIITDAALLRERFNRANQEVSDLEQKLEETLQSNMEQTVYNRLSGIFSNAFKSELTNLNSLFSQPDRNFHRTIHEHINQLPSLNMEDINQFELSEEMALEINNIIATAKKYTYENDNAPKEEDNKEVASSQIQEIKNQLVETGVVMENSVELPANQKTGQTFTLSIPKEYELQSLWLMLPNSDEVNYTKKYKEDGLVKLPANDEGVFKVRIQLQLKDANSKIDIFQPATWSWNMLQEDIEDVGEQYSYRMINAPLIANSITVKETEEPVETHADGEDGKQEKEEESNHEDDGHEEDVLSSEDQERPEQTKPQDKENQDETKVEEQEQIIEKVEVFNNHIHHQVMSSVVDDETHGVHTISKYQKLSALFETYFGLDMSSPTLQDTFEGKRLSELATESSLYHLFHVQELDELLVNYVLERVASDVTEELREPTAQLYDQIRRYHERSIRSEDLMDQLVGKLALTTKHAQIMNQSLSDVLKDVLDWRDRSLALVDEQSVVQASIQEEQQVIMVLSNAFVPLLTTSETLADQARSNFNTASGVYKTLDDIDNQATMIQVSGNDLISKAEELSINLTNKLVEDEEFATNFTDVLANSRIGDRQNEDLIEFLSSPVHTKNDGVIVSGTTFAPYFIVLIAFIIAFFTAYVISTNHQQRLKRDEFEGERSIFSQNTPITIITACIGIIEGVAIGLISGYILKIEESSILLWTLLILTIVLTILLISTYLLRQVKMIGMFLLLTVLGMYLFFTRALGSVGDGGLRAYSPLQYVENILVRFFDGSINYQTTFFILSLLCMAGILLNLIVFRRATRSEETQDEEVSEAS